MRRSSVERLVVTLAWTSASEAPGGASCGFIGILNYSLTKEPVARSQEPGARSQKLGQSDGGGEFCETGIRMQGFQCGLGFQRHHHDATLTHRSVEGFESAVAIAR